MLQLKMKEGGRLRPREPLSRCSAALVVSAPASKTPPSLDGLPSDLLNAVVKLEAPRANGDKAHVYVMGVSHCSKKQAEQVKSLIHAARPEVVMVELCKDRVGLLADGRVEAQAKNLWHVRKVQIEGLPTSDEWPTESSLKKLLVTRAGRPVSTQDIEGDISRLLSTGLFKSARPAAENPPPDEAPEFSISFGDDGKAKLLVIPPLGRVKFVVEPRSLPSINELSVRVDSSLMDAKVDADKLKQAAELVVSEVKSGASSPLAALLKAKQRFAEAIPDASIASTFNGCETGSIEVILKRVKASDLPFESGFEATAVGGEGWGIDPFRPQRPLTKLSNKMFLSTATLESMRKNSRGSLVPSTPSANDEERVKSKESLMEPRSWIRAWTDDEIKGAKRFDPPLDPLADTIKDVLIFLYAKFQYEAGRKTGIERGAAWQAALEAATEVGAQQFVLSDRPTVITEHRFAQGLVGTASLRIGSAIGLFLSTIIVDLFVDAGLGPELGAVAGSLFAGAALMWPLIGPFFEIKRLAGMSAEEIEEAVRQKTPLQQDIDSNKEGNPGKIFGEDALLDWPGANAFLLSERDEFMARATASVATASGPSPPSLCPAFILDRVEDRLVWRLMQGKGAPNETSTLGYGDGEYLPLQDVSCVVNIVGTAHVQGIVKAWQKALSSPADVDNLIKVQGQVKSD